MYACFIGMIPADSREPAHEWTLCRDVGFNGVNELRYLRIDLCNEISAFITYA